MLLIKKSALYLIVFIYSLALLFLGIQFYKIILSLNTNNDLVVKYYAENIIYIILITIIVTNIFTLRIILKNKSVFKVLDKIIDLSQYGNYNCQDLLKRLGVLGEKINFILFQLTDLNLKEALKISSLANTRDFLLESIQSNILLLNSQGTVIKCSKEFEKSFNLADIYFINKNIRDLLTDIDFDGIILSLEKEHGQIQTENKLTLETDKKYMCKVTWHPINNSAHKISNIILTLEKI